LNFIEFALYYKQTLISEDWTRARVLMDRVGMNYGKKFNQDRVGWILGWTYTVLNTHSIPRTVL